MNEIICHAHVTFASNAPSDACSSIGHGWKQTEIIVTGENREDHDKMITKYFKIGSDKYPTLAAVIQEIELIQGVARVKIERTKTWQLVDKTHYAEFHAKVPDGSRAPTAPGWARSRNPRDKDSSGRFNFFYNKRVYSGVMEEIIEQVKAELAGISVIELKIEQNIYDSNRLHDAWWA